MAEQSFPDQFPFRGGAPLVRRTRQALLKNCIRRLDSRLPWHLLKERMPPTAIQRCRRIRSRSTDDKRGILIGFDREVFLMVTARIEFVYEVSRAPPRLLHH